MDARLDENQTVLAVHVLAVPLQMLAHAHGLFDQVVQVLGNLGGKAYKDKISLHTPESGLPAGNLTHPPLHTES